LFGEILLMADLVPANFETYSDVRFQYKKATPRLIRKLSDPYVDREHVAWALGGNKR
jgi:hypothetical protein